MKAVGSTVLALVVLTAGTLAAAPQQPQTTAPALPADAKRLVDQLDQNRAGIIEQLRLLQLTYRDAGHAEEAAAIAAQVRSLAQRILPQAGVSADLVHEGLPNHDEPVLMSLFRNRVGETLSFSIRGRDDQQVWGSTHYTDTSALETAAVHAGLLRPGQRAIVKVVVTAGLEHYDAATQNGVSSGQSDRSGGSFRFASVSIVRRPRTASLASLRDLIGHSVTLPVVGAVSDKLWGSQIYTDDSSLSAAAVHAGVLSVGEFGFVKVTLMPGQQQYEGSAQNGVTSQPFGVWDGSFRVERGADVSAVQLPGGEDGSRIVSLAELRRTAPGTNFVVQVVGGAAGPVWGSGTYTDDSSIAAAAVHAGLLKPGETGLLRVFIDGSHDQYAASARNGVTSQSFGPWEGSFRLERVRP